MNLMTVTDSSPLICLLCHSNIDLNAFTNIFYTSFPHNEETLSNFVLKILKLTDSDIASSYLCLKCFNLFWALEQAQNTAKNVQSEIFDTFQTNYNEQVISTTVDNSDKDAIENSEKENSEEANNLDDKDKPKDVIEDYLTEKDIHSLKSIFSEVTSGTVISIQLINKQVNEYSIISKGDESQTITKVLNEPCVDSQENIPLNSQILNLPVLESEIDIISNEEAVNLEDSNSTFSDDVAPICHSESEDQSQFKVWQYCKKNADAGIQCDFTDRNGLASLELEDSQDIPTSKNSKRKCKNCKEIFRTETELRTHLLNKHPNLRPYCCEKCGKAYKHKPALEIHLGMHAGFSPYKCSKCSKCFTQKGALHRHLPLHTGEAPFQCDICGKRFVHHTSYNMHILSHTGKKAYQCDVCDQYLLSTSHLKRHMRVHTGEKPFNCTLCGKNFAERYNLQAHQKIHDPEQAAAKEAKRNQHKCVRCTATFGTKAKYMDHLRTHVGELVNEKPRSRISRSNNEGIGKKSQELNGVDLLATCVNEVWQSLSLNEDEETVN